MRHIAYITKKPERSGKYSLPDGAINGNGDLAVILGNSPNGMRIFISKIDLWNAVEQDGKGGLRPLGYIDIAINEALYNNYYVEQDMDLGEIFCKFKKGVLECSFKVRVNKTENSIVISQSGNMDIFPILKVFEGDTDGRKGSFDSNGVKGIFRSFDMPECQYETHCFAAMKKIKKGLYYFFAATNHDTVNPEQLTTEKINSADETSIALLYEKHKTAWVEFWSKSSFHLSDRELENSWYASEYFLAVSAGNKHFPPGLYANFITVERPAWHSDYHLNYNYQAPFYHVCSSNHVELTDCYAAPLEEFLKRGNEFAARFGCGGVIYPVGIAPKGMCTELDTSIKYSFERLFLGQKNNQIHPADILAFRWRATRDKQFAKDHAYPYIKACLEFFEDYGTWENGKFSVCCDAAHEVPIYKENFSPKKYKKYLNDKNNTVTLGMLRLCLAAAIDMAQALEIDEDKRKKWQNILDNLAPFKTYYRLGKKVFRYTQKGQAWNETGDVGLQHVYPGCCVGLNSSEEALKIARATFRQKLKCFDDDNAVTSYFPMAARLGYPPETIIKKLRELNKKKMLPNLLYLYEGGGLEYCSIVANTLNEMAMQSFEGIIMLFPDWDNSIDCEFNNLRADGAFLVSSSIKSGQIGSTRIFSEVGGKVRVSMPQGSYQIVTASSEKILKKNFFEFSLEPGEIAEITLYME